jgi:hypothetical protein
MKSRTYMAKTTFNKKTTLFTSKMDLNMYSAETWILWKANQKYL